MVSLIKYIVCVLNGFLKKWLKIDEIFSMLLLKKEMKYTQLLLVKKMFGNYLFSYLEESFNDSRIVLKLLSLIPNHK